MSRASDPSATPRHRGVSLSPGAEGSVTPSLVWKVCAVLPLVLLCVLMSVRVADSFGKSDSPESSKVEDPAAVTSDPATPSPSATASEQARKRKTAALESEIMNEVLPSDAVTSEAVIPSPVFELPPGAPDATATVPTKSPTKKPGATGAPSPTPTPEEARRQCREEGVNVLDVAALAKCIADLMDP